jgi:hypothetical protein
MSRNSGYGKGSLPYSEMAMGRAVMFLKFWLWEGVGRAEMFGSYGKGLPYSEILTLGRAVMFPEFWL